MLLKLLRERLRDYRCWLAALVALQLVSVIASLYLPSLNAAIIDKGLSRGDTDFIWHTGMTMLLVTLLQVVAAAGATYVGAHTATGFGRDVRSTLFRTVGRFSGREVNQFGAPSLITRSTNDVQQVQMLVLMGCTMVVAAPIMMVGGVVMALREDVGLSWLMVVAVPVLAIAIGLIVSRMVPGFRLVQQRLDGVNRVLREQLMGVRVIRAFVREPYETQRFTRANADLTEVSRRVNRLMGAMFPIVMLVMNASTVAVLWFGGHRVGDGDMQVGSLTAYMTYLIQILMAVMMATFMVMMIPRASVSAERVREVLDTETSVAPPAEPVRVERVRGVVELDHVTMCYPGADVPVLRDVSLRAEPGRTVAVIGSTGSGKSTLISLVARLFDATGGRVTIDGVDVRQLDPALLWGHLGIVPQKPYLFSGTVASNLRYGNPDASDEELWAALEVAQAKGFVEKMDGGLDAAIAQGGTNVSGGQRQRLCIARALVARPSIYLFDDSFSALDLATDARLRKALTPYTKDATVFIVAQRVSTITDADQIVVLDDGLVVGRGTHEELLETCETYQEIVASQAAEEVAA
ncbi:ABC transporter ATP-binding protein [Luteipulveratus sp. YIM 133132]|uniref:ABC transporter ATP-binding protein n=1 Tax=Luteipulveratus flavus TaxID=3031728 RepID=UPI0023B07974|nr:ABC transporter ATP-binding protein [Luteipulveratus sp. YIM 133132]MDE9364659.1 ABC transporter ATP-binding protein [Luteipulveratus sp. YIM 133132]